MQRMLALPVSQLEEEMKASTERSAVLSPPDEEGPIYRRLAVDDLQPAPDGSENSAATDIAGDELPPVIPQAPSLLLTTPANSVEADGAPQANDREESGRNMVPGWESGLPASPEVLAAISERPRPTERHLAAALGLPERANASLPEPVFAWWMRPLVWCDQVFEQGTTWLGEPGEWLRSGAGRAVLGWSGILLLAGAITWALLVGLG
jgi:hypothetical protein